MNWLREPDSEPLPGYRARIDSGTASRTVWTRVVRDDDVIDAESYEVTDREIEP